MVRVGNSVETRAWLSDREHAQESSAASAVFDPDPTEPIEYALEPLLLCSQSERTTGPPQETARPIQWSLDQPPEVGAWPSPVRRGTRVPRLRPQITAMPPPTPPLSKRSHSEP